MDDEKEITIKQIELTWDFAKTETDVHCRVFLQAFVVLLTVGFSIIIAGLTDSLKNYSQFTSLAGGILIFTSLYYAYKTYTITGKLKDAFQYIIIELDKLSPPNQDDGENQND